MFQFIITNVFMLSFGGVLYMTARALPRLGEEEEKKLPFFERLVKSGVPERLDRAFRDFEVKFLRKTKVYLLKIENTITARLRTMSPDSAAPFGGKTSAETARRDFKDILEEKEGEKGNF